MKRRKRMRHALAVFDNGNAPAGWVEIQRDDPPDDDRLLPVEDDLTAAMLVAEHVGARGTACRYYMSKGVLVPLLRTAPDADVEADVTNETHNALMENGGSWIHVVPARVAFEAGLITRKREREALRRMT